MTFTHLFTAHCACSLSPSMVLHFAAAVIAVTVSVTSCHCKHWLSLIINITLLLFKQACCQPAWHRDFAKTHKVSSLTETKQRNKISRITASGTATLRGTAKLKDSGPVETVYQSCYGHISQHQAIIVRSDGSAVAQYPTEGVAVSVDPENTGWTSSENSLRLAGVQ
jgi:hypothetical protein